MFPIIGPTVFENIQLNAYLPVWCLYWADESQAEGILDHLVWSLFFLVLFQVLSQMVHKLQAVYKHITQCHVLGLLGLF